MKYCVLMLAIIFCPQGHTLSQADKSFEENFQDADLVFKGKVVNLENKSSLKTGNEGPIPHTFVTYKVLKVIKGNYSNEFLTLRFYGGEVENERGSFLRDSGYPFFDFNDKDILFVKGNTKSACPLTSCSGGRIRLINGSAFTDNGTEIRNKANKLATGNKHILKEVVHNKLGWSQTPLMVGLGPKDFADGIASNPELKTLSVLQLESILIRNAKRLQATAVQIKNADPKKSFNLIY